MKENKQKEEKKVQSIIGRILTKKEKDTFFRITKSKTASDRRLSDFYKEEK